MVEALLKRIEIERAAQKAKDASTGGQASTSDASAGGEGEAAVELD